MREAEEIRKFNINVLIGLFGSITLFLGIIWGVIAFDNAVNVDYCGFLGNLGVSMLSLSILLTIFSLKNKVAGKISVLPLLAGMIMLAYRFTLMAC